ncbi:MAG: hypothetical protein PHP44_00735 [Kiritimatiellae bacterium]|nr:hypothetical protein [Kiritimatiellia bacterium]MDD4734610.1 hypothetical protein [Kiritimatiellia bacterium]
MIAESTGRIMTSNYIDMTPLFDGLTKQLKSHTNMLQHGAGLMNPSRRPSLFIDPQSVKNAVSMHGSGMQVNIQA